MGNSAQVGNRGIDIQITHYNANMTTKNKTNIEVYNETWKRLKDMKEQPGESFDDIIRREVVDG